MSFLVPERVDTPELLDEENPPYEEMVRSLHDLRRINYYAGGIRAYRRLLRRFFRDSSSQNKIVLDLGTGTSDLLDDAAARFGVRGVGLDVKIEHLVIGRALYPRSAKRLAASAFEIPLRNESVDLVTSSHFFHHFSAQENLSILREALRVARMGVIVTDTRRNLLPYAFMKILGAARLIGSITAFDGPASVLRGYTTAELQPIVRELDVSRAEIVRLMPFRFAILLWK